MNSNLFFHLPQALQPNYSHFSFHRGMLDAFHVDLTSPLLLHHPTQQSAAWTQVTAFNNQTEKGEN